MESVQKDEVDLYILTKKISKDILLVGRKKKNNTFQDSTYYMLPHILKIRMYVEFLNIQSSA